MRFKAMTYNPGGDNSRSELAHWLRANTDDVDVFSGQEFRHKLALARACGLDRPYGVDSAAPVLVGPRGRLRYIAGTAMRLWLSDETYVGGEGAGPPTLAEKHASVARFVDPRCGRRVWVASLHLAPSLQVPIQPGADISRRELHADQVMRAAAFLSTLRGAAIVQGDWNCLSTDPNMDPMWDAGFTLANGPGPTHGHRRIDLSLYRRRRGLDVVRSRVIKGANPDDHDAVVTTYRWTS